MTDRMKKIVFGVVFIIISIILGFVLWFVFFRPLFPSDLTEPEPTAPGSQLPGGQLEPSGPGTQTPGTGTQTPGTGVPGSTGGTGLPTAPTRVTLLRDGVTQAVSPSAKNQGVRFYNPDDGRFYTINPDGTTNPLADKQFYNVENVNWGKTDDKAILEFPDGSNVYYDFTTKRQVTLPKHWEDFDFSPDDKRIVAKSIGLDPSNRFLIVANADGNEARAVESLGGNAHLTEVSWSPNNHVIGFAYTGDPQAEGARQVLLIGENRENFKSLIVPGRGFVPNWSPTGRQILYSVYHERDGLRPTLWVSDGAGEQIGDNRRGLKLNTWADKCVWRDESSIICGVPRSLDVGAGLSRQNFAGVPDDVFLVDLTTGISTKINTPEQNYPIRNPVLSDDKRKLLFTDAATGRLYSYDLP